MGNFQLIQVQSLQVLYSCSGAQSCPPIVSWLRNSTGYGSNQSTKICAGNGLMITSAAAELGSRRSLGAISNGVMRADFSGTGANCGPSAGTYRAPALRQRTLFISCSIYEINSKPSVDRSVSAGGGGPMPSTTAATATPARRTLQGGRARAISNQAIQADRIPCNKRGGTWANCRPGKPAHRYTRGCSAITQCARNIN